MWRRDFSTAMCWKRSISLGSETQSIEPAPRFSMICATVWPSALAANSGTGKPGSWTSWAIFSSRVICLRRSAARDFTLASGIVGLGLVDSCCDWARRFGDAKRHTNGRAITAESDELRFRRLRLFAVWNFAAKKAHAFRPVIKAPCSSDKRHRLYTRFQGMHIGRTTEQVSKSACEASLVSGRRLCVRLVTGAFGGFCFGRSADGLVSSLPVAGVRSPKSLDGAAG